MNCVYDAFSQHLRYLNKPEYADVFKKYVALKQASHGTDPVYTFAGLVPWLYAGMLYEYNQRQKQKLSMVIQWNYVTWQECYVEAEPKHQSLMRFYTPYWGENVNKITLKPAVYGLLNEQHAVFSKEIPSWPGARIVLAVQIREADMNKLTENLKGETNND